MSQPHRCPDNDATESTPLLRDDEITLPSPSQDDDRNGHGKPPPPASAADPNPSGSSNDDDRPLPKLQILLLCFTRMTEPIAFFGVFPYIGQMVERNGHLPPTEVGFYSGIIESLFSASQMLVLILWGRLADRAGRRPVMVASLAGMAIGPVLFGLTTTIWQMILCRCLAGVFSGSTLIIRTMVAEHSTPENQARAFSWFAFGGNLGIFLGPIIGGALAEPATQFPGAFGGVPFFEEYPYALSGFVTGGISASAAILNFFFLEETLPKNDKKADPTTSPSSTVEADPSEMTMWQIVRSPGVGFVLWFYNHVMLLAFAFTAILPIALYTPIKDGGVGFNTTLIAIYMAAQGASQAIWLLLAFPLLQKRFGTKGVMRCCGIAYPIFFAGYIVLNYLLRDGTHTARVWFWILGTIIAFIGPGVAMAFTGAQLMLNDVTPDARVLGTLNAIALTVSSGIRAIVPGVSTVIYAIGTTKQILGGHLAWVILIPLAMVFAVSANWLPEGKKPRLAREADDEES